MSGPFAAGRKADGICDRCGLTYKLSELHKETVNRNITNLKVCPECLDVDHEQFQLGRLDPTDPIALREPRPDRSDGTSPNDRYVTSLSFDFNNTADSWYSQDDGFGNDFTILTIGTTYINVFASDSGTSQTGLERSRSTSPLSIDASVYKKVRAMIRVLAIGTNPSTWQGIFSWYRTSDIAVFNFSGKKRIFPQPTGALMPIGQWILFEWDMTDDPNWTGTIDGARISPVEGALSEFDCEYIRFESV